MSGKSSKRKRQPDNVCWQCVEFSGKLAFNGIFAKPDAEGQFGIHEGICDLCKNKALLVPVKMIGYFTVEQLGLIRQEIDRRNLKRSDGLNPKSVEKALMIVEGVLGEGMSYWTRKVWKGVKEDFERGKTIHKYDLEKLMFWFAKDVEMRKEVSADGGDASGGTDGGQPDRGGLPANGGTNPVGRDGDSVEGEHEQGCSGDQCE